MRCRQLLTLVQMALRFRSRLPRSNGRLARAWAGRPLLLGFPSTARTVRRFGSWRRLISSGSVSQDGIVYALGERDDGTSVGSPGGAAIIPAISDGEMLVRSEKDLYSIGKLGRLLNPNSPHRSGHCNGSTLGEWSFDGGPSNGGRFIGRSEILFGGTALRTSEVGGLIWGMLGRLILGVRLYRFLKTRVSCSWHHRA